MPRSYVAFPSTLERSIDVKCPSALFSSLRGKVCYCSRRARTSRRHICSNADTDTHRDIRRSEPSILVLGNGHVNIGTFVAEEGTFQRCNIEGLMSCNPKNYVSRCLLLDETSCRELPMLAVRVAPMNESVVHGFFSILLSLFLYFSARLKSW